MASKPYSQGQERMLTQVLKLMSPLNAAVYRISGGRLGGSFPGGAPVCLLTTTGRKSGQRRTVPLLYIADGDNVVIVASKGGMATHPDWYLNLVDNPDVDVQIRKVNTKMNARTASSEEKSELWPRLVKMYKGYDSYQSRTSRDIPVVICSPVA